MKSGAGVLLLSIQKFVNTFIDTDIQRSPDIKMERNERVIGDAPLGHAIKRQCQKTNNMDIMRRNIPLYHIILEYQKIRSNIADL